MRLNKHPGNHGAKRLHLQPRFIRYMTLTSCVCMLLAVSYGDWGWCQAIRDRLVSFTGDIGLRVERIEIKGRRNTDMALLKEKIAVPWYTPIFGTDLAAIHERVNSIGWIRAARIERRFPTTLAITLDERFALAIYQDEKGHHVIDRTGAVIGNLAVEDFTHLPVIKGANAPGNALEILEALKKEGDLYSQVWALAYQSNRRWDVFLRSNIRIQLPEVEPGKAWEKLASMDRTRHLTSRDIINIDMRIPEKLVIRSSHTSQKGNST